MSDTWARCGPCDRWFYIEDPTLVDLLCPACLTPGTDRRTTAERQRVAGR